MLTCRRQVDSWYSGIQVYKTIQLAREQVLVAYMIQTRPPKLQSLMVACARMIILMIKCKDNEN